MAFTDRFEFSKWHSESEVGCWEWLGFVSPSGYGRFRSRQAHRVSYELFKDTPPAGVMVCHTCDNRKCVNPKHLFLGTAKDNMSDCRAKGRNSKGESHPRSKMTDAQVKEAFVLYGLGWKQKDIASKFGVRPQCIQGILSQRRRVG